MKYIQQKCTQKYNFPRDKLKNMHVIPTHISHISRTTFIYINYVHIECPVNLGRFLLLTPPFLVNVPSPRGEIPEIGRTDTQKKQSNDKMTLL